MMFLQKILGLASKDQIKVHMGDSMKTKILMLKEIPPSTVNERLQNVMESSDKAKFGYVDKHGQVSKSIMELVFFMLSCFDLI